MIQYGLTEKLHPVNVRQSKHLLMSVQIPVAHVSKIRIRTTSKDQGWSSARAEVQGTFEESWSWFEAQVTDLDLPVGSQKDPSEAGERIIVNRHAGRAYEHHEKIWNTKTKQGQYLHLWACAMFPGWENKVWDAHIDISYTPEVIEAEED